MATVFLAALSGSLIPRPAQALDAPAGQTGAEALPAHPGSGKAGRILFLGNSITLHGPKADIGWSGNWGMAASSQDKDFVHLLLSRIAAKTQRQPEALIANVADFERQFETYDVSTQLKQQLDFKPDIVVLAIGENVLALSSAESRTKFRSALAALLASFKKAGNPAVFVRSCFWADQTKDGILQEVCKEAGGTFVDISRLGQDASNQARSERHFQHDGVAAHPGDKGMQALAHALWSAISGSVFAEQPERK